MPVITSHINLSLTSGPGTFAIKGTEGKAMSVYLSVMSGGRPFDCTGYTVALWYGPSPAEGHVVAAEQVGFGFVKFALEAGDTATRGNLMAQITAVKGDLTEEWARGWFTLQRDPSADYDPITWNSNFQEWLDTDPLGGLLPKSVLDGVDLPPDPATFSQVESTLRALLAALKGQ